MSPIFPGMLVLARTPWSSRSRPAYVLATQNGTIHLAYCALDRFEHRRNHQVRVVGHNVGATLICPYRIATIHRNDVVKILSQLPPGIIAEVEKAARSVEIPSCPGKYASVHYGEKL